jgi:hypothetical protein
MRSQALRGFFAILILLAATKAISGEVRKTLVEVWCVGDDQLTHKLRDSLEDKFKTSAGFQMSYGKRPGTLVVSIPTNVPWKKEGTRTRVLYTINFTSTDGLNLGSSRGSCLDDDIDKCTIRIVSDAKRAARKIH